MSDTPQGGWWKASDGKWYPPEVHPDRLSAAPDADADADAGGAASAAAPEPAAELPHSDAPLPGWIKGADGHWYPPHLEAPTVRPGSSGGSAAAAAASTDGDAPRSRRPVILVGALVVLLAAVGVGWVLLGGDDSPEVAGTTTRPPTTSAPVSTTDPAATSSSTTTTTTTPPPPPAQVSGDGTAEVPVGGPVDAPYLALVTHDGPGAFDLTLLAAGGAVAQSPLGGAVSGNYLGVLPVNFGPNESFDTARVVGEGPWAVTFALLDSAPVLDTTSGATHQGRGDQVLQLRSDDEVTVTVTCATCAPAISLVAWPGTGVPATRVAVNGATAVVPAGTRYLQVTARSGPGTTAPDWSLGAA